MKWMRERDLLIAQTMAFVQSVTGKPPEALKTMTTSAAVVTIETSESSAEPAPLAEIAALLAQKVPVPAPAPMEMPIEIARPTPLPRLDLRDDFQSEIKARVASFRAHQERFNREREAYCAATMAKVHASLREENPPPRTAK